MPSSLERALDLIQHLADAPDGTGVIELGTRLGAPPSSIHRLLGLLVRRGFVTQDRDTKRYALGPAMLKIANAHVGSDSLLTTAAPHIERLRAHTTESVFLSRLVGDEVVCLASAESPRALRYFIRSGQRMPKHASASARAILAFLQRTEAERLLATAPLERYTESTPTTIAEVMEELQRVRSEGYAVCDHEIDPGVIALAAPIRNARGDVNASLAVVAPETRLRPNQRVLAIRLLTEAAEAISQDLGYKRTPVVEVAREAASA